MTPSRILVRFLLPVLVLALAARPARADRDQVQFGTNIVVPAGETIHDAVCFFCSVNAQGTIDHDVVVFFGDVHIAGHANHDVVNFFGTVRADDNASIAHDLVSMVGSIRLGENVTIGNDMVAMFGGVHAADSVVVNGNRVIQPFWLLLIPIVIVGGIIALIANVVRNFRHRQLMAAAYAYPPPPPPPAPPAQPHP
jgi:hypothetical protein